MTTIRSAIRPPVTILPSTYLPALGVARNCTMGGAPDRAVSVGRKTGALAARE
jgi:hypothetical protein